MIFVDTSAWFAAYVPNDANHAAATVFLQTANDRLITTDFIIDETLTLLKARGEFQRAVLLGWQLMSRNTVRLEWVQRPDFERAMILFRTLHDQRHSFTD